MVGFGKYGDLVEQLGEFLFARPFRVRQHMERASKYAHRKPMMRIVDVGCLSVTEKVLQALVVDQQLRFRGQATKHFARGFVLQGALSAQQLLGGLKHRVGYLEPMFGLFDCRDFIRERIEKRRNVCRSVTTEALCRRVQYRGVPTIAIAG